MIFNLVAEGYTEEIVASRLLPFCGHELGTVYGKKGSGDIRKKAAVYSYLATEYSGVLVLTDFRDTGAACVPTAIQEYILNRLPCPPKTFLCRFAVNEVESWLLADRKGMAEFMRIPISRMPHQPENETYPKRTLINLARSSRNRRIREGIAPPPGHHADVGPQYMNLLQKFITDFWNIEAAMSSAQSLERCVRRLRSLSCI